MSGYGVVHNYYRSMSEKKAVLYLHGKSEPDQVFPGSSQKQ